MASMNVNDALKELYLALGGDSSAIKNGMTVTDYVVLLKNVLSGDSGSSILVVTITGNVSDPNVTYDKNFEDIAQALSEGKLVIGKFIDGNERPYYSFVSGKEEDGYFSFKFETNTSYEFEDDTLYYSISIMNTSIDSSNEISSGGLNATFSGSGDFW